MKRYFLNERTENGVVTLNHFNTIEEAEIALNEIENATEIDTFEEEGETVEMEVLANTGDYYISTRPSDDYKEAHADEFAAEDAAVKAAKAEAKAKAKAEKKAALENNTEDDIDDDIDDIDENDTDDDEQ